METYTFLKGRQYNKWCSLKKFDFSNRTNKVGRREYILKFLFVILLVLVIFISIILGTIWYCYNCVYTLWVLIWESTQAQVETRILGLQRILYLLFGGLNLVYRSYIRLITNQVMHKTWALQHIGIHTCKYIHIVK